MSARSYYDPDAGDFLAYRDEPWRRNPDMRDIAFVWSDLSSTTDAATARRYDTQEEAKRAAQTHWGRSANARRGGMRLAQALVKKAEYRAAKDAYQAEKDAAHVDAKED